MPRSNSSTTGYRRARLPSRDARAGDVRDVRDASDTTRFRVAPSTKPIVERRPAPDRRRPARHRRSSRRLHPRVRHARTGGCDHRRAADGVLVRLPATMPSRRCRRGRVERFTSGSSTGNRAPLEYHPGAALGHGGVDRPAQRCRLPRLHRAAGDAATRSPRCSASAPATSRTSPGSPTPADPARRRRLQAVTEADRPRDDRGGAPGGGE